MLRQEPQTEQLLGRNNTSQTQKKSSDAMLCFYTMECQGVHQQKAAKNRFWEKTTLLPDEQTSDLKSLQRGWLSLASNPALA